MQKSCVDQLCDSLCYRVDIASFVACVNAGHTWNSEFSILFPKNGVASTVQDTYSDPFVENFVLERLSVQSPLRVRLTSMSHEHHYQYFDDYCLL